MIDHASEHEQQVGQAVDVRQHRRIDALCAERHDRPLGTPADRAAQMQERARGTAARQDEPPQRRQFGFGLIDPILEALDVGIGDGCLGDPLADSVGRIGQPRAQGEQVLLNVLEHLTNVARQFAVRTHGTEARVQLVNVAVGGDARIAFRHTRAAEERCASGIAGPRVDLHGRQYT